jgi:uncharacterized membrane protein YcaP (DUF421 family)
VAKILLMIALLQIDWKAVFVPAVNLWEIVLRGSFIYLFLFLLLRVLRREAGSVGISDLLVVVLIADAAQNALGSEYKSVTEGAVLVVTIVGWDYFLDWLGYRFPALRSLLKPKPLPLIKDGKVLRRNLRKEMISMEELEGELRKNDVDDIADVKHCYMEPDGHISVVKKGKS